MYVQHTLPATLRTDVINITRIKGVAGVNSLHPQQMCIECM